MDKEENTLGNLIVVAVTAQLDHNDSFVQKLEWHKWAKLQVLQSIISGSHASL